MDIRYLKGVGEKRAAQLAKLGIFTVDDLLGFYPVSYTHLLHCFPVERRGTADLHLPAHRSVCSDLDGGDQTYFPLVLLGVRRAARFE